MRVLKLVDGYFRVLKAVQLGLFGGEKRVGKPGSRGGRYYMDRDGHVRYGTPPPDRQGFDSQEDVVAHHDAQRPKPRPGVVYLGGDAAEHTGRTEQKHGGTFHEYRYTEGHRKGETRWSQQTPPNGEAPVPSRQKLAADPHAAHYEAFRSDSTPEEEHAQANDLGFSLDEWKALPKAERGKYLIRAEAEHATRGKLGEHASMGAFKLQPPEIGQTKSGKPIPHPEDPQTHNQTARDAVDYFRKQRADLGRGAISSESVTGKPGTRKDAQAWLDERIEKHGKNLRYSAEHAAHFRDWTKDDHLDAGKVHHVYATHHRGKESTGGGEPHRALARLHEDARDEHNAVATTMRSRK